MILNAKYYNGLYTIVLGEGKGKSLEGSYKFLIVHQVKKLKRNLG